MSTKILHWIGVGACVLLIVSCFLPWAYYADINKHFTGFYSYDTYGKPGKFFVLIAGVSMIFMLLPRLWAKRVNLFLTALGVGYAIRTYVLFTSCYRAYCPEKEPAIYLMVISSVLMLVAAVFPQMSMSQVPAKKN